MNDEHIDLTLAFLEKVAGIYVKRMSDVQRYAIGRNKELPFHNGDPCDTIQLWQLLPCWWNESSIEDGTLTYSGAFEWDEQLDFYVALLKGPGGREEHVLLESSFHDSIDLEWV